MSDKKSKHLVNISFSIDQDLISTKDQEAITQIIKSTMGNDIARHFVDDEDSAIDVNFNDKDHSIDITAELFMANVPSITQDMIAAVKYMEEVGISRDLAHNAVGIMLGEINYSDVTPNKQPKVTTVYPEFPEEIKPFEDIRTRDKQTSQITELESIINQVNRSLLYNYGDVLMVEEIGVNSDYQLGKDFECNVRLSDGSKFHLSLDYKNSGKTQIIREIYSNILDIIKNRDEPSDVVKNKDKKVKKYF